MSGGVKLAVDIGGTFTDLVLERDTGRFQVKLLTTRMAPEKAVLEGVHRILEQSITKAEEVKTIIHGTTLATNALIERTGAITGMIVTEGFTGNVVLKLAEGLAAGLFKTIAHEIFAIDPDLALKFEPVMGYALGALATLWFFNRLPAIWGA